MCMKDAIQGICPDHAPITIKISIDPSGLMQSPGMEPGSSIIQDKDHSYCNEDPIGCLIDKIMACMGKSTCDVPCEETDTENPCIGGTDDDEDEEKRGAK